jgi:hypothetical protein
LLPSSGEEASDLVDPLDRVILSQSIEGLIRLDASLPEKDADLASETSFLFKKN